MNERSKNGFLRLRQSGEDSGEILSRFAANEPRFGVQRRAVGAHEREREHQIESRRQACPASEYRCDGSLSRLSLRGK